MEIQDKKKQTRQNGLGKEGGGPAGGFLFLVCLVWTLPSSHAVMPFPGVAIKEATLSSSALFEADR